jgi:dipeptidyl aminopeptidase/acylaminoacyl peptidase
VVNRRRRTRRRRIGAAIRQAIGGLILLGILGAATVAAVKLIPPLLEESERATGSPSPTPRRTPACITRRLPSPETLGSVAWVRDGAIEVMNLTTCRTRTVVESGADPPVRFSPDGEWLAFGQGSVIPVRGGDQLRPVGTVTEWSWMPHRPTLVGVTAEGGLNLGGPEEPPRTLLPDGSGATHPIISPDGTRVAADVLGSGVQVIDVETAEALTVFPDDDGQTRIAAWSSDGEWVLFSLSPDVALTDDVTNALPLNAVPAEGGDWFNVFSHVQPLPGNVVPCGEGVAFPGGEAPLSTVNKQILLSEPPEWGFRNATDDFLRSWLFPQCSPDGRFVVATGAPNRPEEIPGSAARSLWVIPTDGSPNARLTDAPQAAFEAARWSADGETILVVRRGLRPTAPGFLVAIGIDPQTGEAVSIVGSLAEIGPGGDPATGTVDWAERIDWYRTGQPSTP